jgi:hypothetical protein
MALFSGETVMHHSPRLYWIESGSFQPYHRGTVVQSFGPCFAFQQWIQPFFIHILGRLAGNQVSMVDYFC